MFASFLQRARLALAALVALPALALAQTGQVTGLVTDGAKAPLAGATVTVEGPRLAAVTDAYGRYTIRSVPAGTYTVRVARMGSKATAVPNVVVPANGSVTVDASLDAAPVTLGGVVVSASRRAQKITDAPATITRIEASAIDQTIGNSFAPALKEVKGLDFIQVGITAVAVNARGFNSSFNNRMLMMEDGRIAVLPENGLPAGAFTTLPKLDLAGMEVLIGPGAALYGPDASNGVITLQSKDPKAYQGWSGELSTGSRGFWDMQMRYARATKDGKWAYKLSGEMQEAQDFESRPVYPAVNATGPITERGTDFTTNVQRLNGALVRYFDKGGRLELNAGGSKSNGIGQTNVGRNQLIDWQYRHAQLKFTSPRWYAQVYRTQSLSGRTFQLNGFSQNRVRFPTISDDSVKALSDFPADGRLMAGEIQNNFQVGMLLKTGIAAIDNTNIVWGGQYRRDQVSSKRQWLSDRLSGEEIAVAQVGGYAQIETPITSQFRFVGAARYDKHDRYDPQFSPKAALLFTPIEDQTFRVGFNRAFKSPTLLQTDFYFPNFQPFIGVFGNLDGFLVRNAAGATVATYDPIVPEINNTWELGYKGVIKQRLYVDVAAYRSQYENFLSPLAVIANPLLGAAATTAVNRRTGAVVGSEVSAGPQVALTYLNLGKATISGVDLGVKAYFTDKVSGAVSLSLISLDSLEKPGGALANTANEATAFNSSTTKLTAGMDFTEILPSTNMGFSGRYVNGFDFRSGVNFGRIPTFYTFDLTGSVKLPLERTRLTWQVQNLYTCVGGISIPPSAGISAANRATYVPGQQCGFGQTHQEMINMPQIGTMLFVGVRFDR